MRARVSLNTYMAEAMSSAMLYSSVVAPSGTQARPACSEPPIQIRVRRSAMAGSAL